MDYKRRKDKPFLRGRSPGTWRQLLSRKGCYEYTLRMEAAGVTTCHLDLPPRLVRICKLKYRSDFPADSRSTYSHSYQTGRNSPEYTSI